MKEDLPPLLEAAKDGNLVLVKKLLKAGADINTKRNLYLLW